MRIKYILYRAGILKLPKVEPPKTIQQLTMKEKTKAIEQKRREQGWACCYACGRSAGLRYGEGKGVTLKAIKQYEGNELVKRDICTDCLSKGGGE